MVAKSVINFGRFGLQLLRSSFSRHGVMDCLLFETPRRHLTSKSLPPRQFYRRPLPASCIAFATIEGRRIFKEALDAGFMEAYFDLAPQLRTQVG